MKVLINNEEISKGRMGLTYQEPFPPVMECRRVSCRGKAYLIMLIDDDEGLIRAKRPSKAEIWPHDCTAIALYICAECGDMIADWNQG